MILSIEEIKALAQPHKVFSDADTLVEHQELLDRLPVEDQIKLASTMVLHCPEQELKNLNVAVRAIRKHESTEESFHTVISGLLEIRKRIIGLNDKRNVHPHNQLLAPEANIGLFAVFKDFSLSVLDTYNTTALAEKLALSTPTDRCSELAQNVHHAFPGSQLATEIGSAFALRREIGNKLLQDSPHLFFISPEVNPEVCSQFPQLFQIIEDKDKEIAAKLEENTPPELRSAVLAKINAIFPESSLLAKTAAAFAPVTVNPFTLFKAAPKQVEETMEVDLKNSMEF